MYPSRRTLNTGTTMNLGDRMKAYEDCYDFKMQARTPIVIRVDGKGFSKYTKAMGFKKPFDETLMKAMAETTRFTASSIEGCLFGYTQSDESTFVLRNDQSDESQPWFNNRIQKMVSITSSLFTAYFASQVTGRQAYFDTRVFAVPTLDEAINCLVWRQRDATKNSIQAAAYYEVSAKEGRKTTQKLMHGLRGAELQELLFQKTGINWNDYPASFKRGIGCYKKKYVVPLNDGTTVERSAWEIDKDLPIFSQDRNFLKEILDFKAE